MPRVVSGHGISYGTIRHVIQFASVSARIKLSAIGAPVNVS